VQALAAQMEGLQEQLRSLADRPPSKSSGEGFGAVTVAPAGSPKDDLDRVFPTAPPKPKAVSESAADAGTPPQQIYERAYSFLLTKDYATAETTFESDLREVAALERPLWRLCEKLARRLQAQGFAAAGVTLKLKTSAFALRTRHARLAAPSLLPETVFEAARPLLRREAAASQRTLRRRAGPPRRPRRRRRRPSCLRRQRQRRGAPPRVRSRAFVTSST
jgi:hypothetical protein